MRLKHVKGANTIIENGKYYVQRPQEYCGNWHKLFQNSNPIHVEIGTGKGDFLIENALKHPSINYIGIEKYDSVLVRAIQKSNELDIPNLKFIRMDALDIDTIFRNEVDIIYLNFSDPWPKERHAKRRLTSPIFLSKYDAIFKNTNHIIMKTDNALLFDYSIESLTNYGYSIKALTRDLYHSNYIEGNIATEYEKKFISHGSAIHYLDAFMNRKES